MDVSELVAEAKSGNADAFTALVRRYQAMAFGYAYASLGDFHLAEDAAQQSFITAYRRLPGLEHPERFGGWLRGIVRFECAHLRRRRTFSQIPLERAAGLAASTPGPVQVVEERETIDRVLAAIKALPQAEREATVLFYIHEHSQREVAAFLNVTVSTVNNRLRAARKRLKEGGLLPMTKDALTQHGLADDFAERVGRIVSAEGPFIDARFAPDRRPPVLNALTITDESSDLALTVEVAQHVGDDLVRCIAMTAPDEAMIGPRAGMRVVDTAAPIKIPLTGEAVAGVISSIRRSANAPSILETGIKVIDLLCPLPAGGLVGLAGDMQTGKMVIVEELIQRLGGAAAPLSLLVFVEAATEVAVIQRLDCRTSAAVEAIYLPVTDAAPDAVGQAMSELDAVLTLSRHLATQQLYPAIDPLRSTSRLLDPAVVGQQHYEVALRVRRLLARDARIQGDDKAPRDDVVLRRAARLRRFLTQPFFVAEASTNRSGRFVPRDATVEGCKAILDGVHDDQSDDAYFMIGTLDEAIAGG